MTGARAVQVSTSPSLFLTVNNMVDQLNTQILIIDV